MRTPAIHPIGQVHGGARVLPRLAPAHAGYGEESMLDCCNYFLESCRSFLKVQIYSFYGQAVFAALISAVAVASNKFDSCRSSLDFSEVSNFA